MGNTSNSDTKALESESKTDDNNGDSISVMFSNLINMGFGKKYPKNIKEAMDSVTNDQHKSNQQQKQEHECKEEEEEDDQLNINASPENNNNNDNKKNQLNGNKEMNSESKAGDAVPLQTVQQQNTVSLEEYKCTVCGEYASPIILQCDNGHILCPKCSPRIRDRKCPICRIKLRFTRNKIAEKELGTKILTCHHCDYHGSIGDMQNHMSNHHPMHHYQFAWSQSTWYQEIDWSDTEWILGLCGGINDEGILLIISRLMDGGVSIQLQHNELMCVAIKGMAYGMKSVIPFSLKQRDDKQMICPKVDNIEDLGRLLAGDLEIYWNVIQVKEQEMFSEESDDNASSDSH